MKSSFFHTRVTQMQQVVLEFHNAFNEGRYEEALKYLDKLMIESPHFLLNYTYRGNCHKSLGNYQSAIEDFTFYIERGTMEDPDFIVGALIDRGNVYSIIGDSSLALDDYQKAIEISSELMYISENVCRAYYNRGLLNEKLGNLTIALIDFQRIVSEMPDIEEYRLALGQIFVKLGIRENSSELIQMGGESYSYVISVLNPYSAKAHYLLGSQFGLLGKHTDALKSLLESEKLGFDEVELYYNIAVSHYELINYNLARDYCQKVFSKDPKNVMTKQLVEMIEALQNI